MSLPTTKVEIAFDSGFSTAEDARTWTDVSTYVEGEQEIPVTYGRADELSAPDPNTCSVTLDNRDGRFTPAKASSPYYPNVKKGKPLRVSVRYAEDGSGNFLSANQASMETSIADWSAGGSVPPTLASSTTHAEDGTKSLRITWGTGGTFPQAGTTCTGLVVGRTYTAQARVWVTTGTPNVLLVIPGGVASGTATATKGAFATISVTFIATASSHSVQVWPSTAPTSGQQLWVDSVMVDEGSAVGTFTTSAPPSYTRFTGYIDAWPLVWPDGSSAASTIAISATSRRAQMGQTAPLKSAIREAYLATEPDAYWPLDDDILNTQGRSVFLDVTNTMVTSKATQSLGAFTTTVGLAPQLNDPMPGVTDEGLMVKFPSFTDIGLYGIYFRYVGASTAINVNSAGEATFEVAARIITRGDDTASVSVMRVLSADASQRLFMTVGAGVGTGAVTGAIQWVDPDTNVLEVSMDVTNTYTVAGGSVSTGVMTPVEFAEATDGQIHHYAMTLSTGGTVGKFYFDGVLVHTLTLPAPFVIDKRLTQVVIGSDTYFADMWGGHGAVHDRALTAAEILSHAAAATAATETPAERVTRVAGRIGVPADEIDAEVSIAMPLGPQAEKGRSAAEVIDEAASSSGGVLYDTREGHLAMQARNHRYNTSDALTLNATTQEISSDLTAVLDARYLINTVEYTRPGVEAGVEAEVTTTLIDQDSIDDYGVHSPGAFSFLSTSDAEVEAAAQNLLTLYAQPRPRISQVTVDLANLSAAQRIAVLGADIGTRFAISSLPDQAPSASMSLFLEGYSESISATSHVLTINTTPADFGYDNVWIADTNDLMDSGIVVGY